MLPPAITCQGRRSQWQPPPAPPHFSLSPHVVFRPVPWWLAHASQLNSGRRRPRRRPACLHSLQHPRPLLFYVAADSYRPLRNALGPPNSGVVRGSADGRRRRHPPACGGGPVPLALCLPPHLPFPNLWLGPPLFLLIGSFHPSPLPMRRLCAGMFSGGGRSAALTHPQFSTGAPPPPCGGCGAPVAALVRPAPLQPLQPLSAPLPHPSLHPLPPSPASLPASCCMPVSLSLPPVHAIFRHHPGAWRAHRERGRQLLQAAGARSSSPLCPPRKTVGSAFSRLLRKRLMIVACRRRLGCLGEAAARRLFGHTHTRSLATPRTCLSQTLALLYRILTIFLPSSAQLCAALPHRACRSPACRNPPLTLGAAPASAYSRLPLPPIFSNPMLLTGTCADL